MQNLKSTPNSRAARILSSDLRLQLALIVQSVPGQSRQRGRFEFYSYLHAVYETYHAWRRKSAAKRTARTLARALNIPFRAGTSPIRILIEATYPRADTKQKSRWVRALECAYAQQTAPKRLGLFIRSNGGIAGCAARAAHDDPKKWTGRSSWDE